ncbi:hypothetical protein BaRGS_00008429 [Batillaria attramentaria]|uniref:AAA+ ATPase domain-containing protein n=1 Tax=Batillaria attramentaria TaxID=370345 RepID=A0ABD0LLR6_9CAEN
MNLQHPFTLLLAGPSGCGKTVFISRLIQLCRTRISPPIDRVVYVYHQHQHTFEQLARDSPVPIQFAESLDLAELTGNCFLVIDDFMGDKAVESKVADYFIKKSHHQNTSVAYMVQNVFHTSPLHRTISLNSHYIWLGKNPRSADQILRLALQVFPKNHRFLREAYEDATKDAYGYLFLDFKQTTPNEHRVRSCVLDDEPVVYVPRV